MRGSNQERIGAPARPSTTRKRPAGDAPLAAQPNTKAVHREESQDDAQQQDEVQLPSQLSQQTVASQPLDAFANTSGSDAVRRAHRPGRGSRIADFIRRLS
ncbi:hypothetical protein AAVH_31201 [Aphelenchoides avenae]|nr:hypothetical protein AAVH_31201 [Aphelenchus avenae]